MGIDFYETKLSLEGEVYKGVVGVDDAYVNLKIEGQERKGRRVHYLMAYSFFGAPPDDNTSKVKKQTCDHVDRDRYNNKLWNLRWASRKEQSANRDVSIMWKGNPLISLVREDYAGLCEEDFNSCRSFIIKQVGIKGNTYEQAKELYRQRGLLQGKTGSIITFRNTPVYVEYLSHIFNVPSKRTQKLIYEGYAIEDIFPTFKIREEDFSESYEVNSRWYPSKAGLCEGEGISVKSLNSRLDKGMSVVDALNHNPYDLNRFTVDEYFMNIPEHCKRLGVSESKVRVYTGRNSMNIFDALDKAKTPTRIIKHEISGVSERYGEFTNEVRRNSDWCRFFGIEPKYSNGRLCAGYTMEQTLTHKGVDITGLTITPYTK